MKALIIGAAGFVGKHLIAHLKALQWDVFATRLPQEHIDTDIPVFELDILHPPEIDVLLEQLMPDCIFHLAAQSSVALSWQKPALTVDVNVKGVIHLLDAARKLRQPPRVLLVGSSEEYGSVLPGELPVREETPLCPVNIYAATKAAQGMIGRIYARAYGLPLVIVRAFNHIGPGQSETFAVSGFCKQIAQIEAGLHPPVINVGNLVARRDFTDVRDIVRAYALLIEKGRSGEVYNVGSGKTVSLQEILDKLLSLTAMEITIEQDNTLLRPSDTPEIVADITRLTELTGWKPEIELQDTLADILEGWKTKA